LLSGDAVGRIFMLGLLAWAQYGPDRPVTGAERRALTGSLLPGLTEQEFRGGVRWHGGITGTAQVPDAEPLAVTPGLAARLARILQEAGDGLAVPPPMLIAMIDVVSDTDAEQIAGHAYGEGLLGIAAAGFEKAAGAADPVLALRNAGNLCQTLNRSGRPDAAIAAADEVIARHPSPGPDVDAALANVLYNRAVALRSRQDAQAGPGRPPALEDVAGAFAAVAAKFAESDDMKARELAARAQLNETGAYLLAADADRGLRAADHFMATFDVVGISPWSDAIAGVMASRAAALVMLGRHREAAQECEQVYLRFSRVPGLAYEIVMARASITHGRALAALGQRDAAISAFGRSSRFTERDDELGQIARQATAEGRALEIEGLEEELAQYDDFLAGPATAEPGNRLLRAKYTVNRGNALAALDRPAEAISAYEGLIDEIRQDSDPELRVQLAMAMTNCGNGYRATGQAEEAARRYREVEEEFGNSGDTRLQYRAALAALNLGGIYADQGELDQGRDEQAVSQFEHIADRYAQAGSSDIRDIALSASWNVALIRLKSGDLAGAIAALLRITETFGSDPVGQIRRRVVGSIIRLALSADERGSRTTALGTLATAARFAGDTDPETADLAAKAQQLRIELGRPT